MFHRPNSNKPARLWLAAAALVSASAVHALPEDSEQQIHIRADEGRFDPDGQSVLTGAVEIEQGTLRLTADRVTVATRDKGLHRIVAEGAAQAPVRFRQQINPDEPFANGRAEHVDYVVAKERLSLKGNAFLSVGEREFAGDVIFWDIKDGRVDARSEDPQGITVKWLPETKPAD